MKKFIFHLIRKSDANTDKSSSMQHIPSIESMKTGLVIATKVMAISLGAIVSIFIILFNIIGCSESHYTGSMLQPGDIDKYFKDHGNGLVCLHTGSDSACVTLVPKIRNDSLPVIHIHPSKTVLLFYYKGQVVMQAERADDNTDLIDDIKDGGQPETDTGPRDDVGGDGQQPPGGTGGDGGDGQQPPGGTGDGQQPPGGTGDGQQPPGGTGGDGQQPPGGTGDGSDGQQPPGGTGGGGSDGQIPGDTNGGGDGQTPDDTNGGGDGQTPDDTNGGDSKQPDDTNGGDGQIPRDPNGGGNNENTNGNNENTNGNNENTNGNNENTNGNGENTNGNGENTNGNGENTNGNGENTNGNGENTNGNGENTNGNGENTNGNGENTNGNGENTNGNGENTNGNGENTNGNGGTNTIPVGETDISTHYYYHTLDPPSGDGWLVHIYYPTNYTGPRKLQEEPEGYGFTITLSHGVIRDFAQTAVGCFDDDDDGQWDKPCNEQDNTTYSVQIYVKTGEPIITITVTWQPPYSGHTKTYRLNRSINLADYGDPRFHPDHTKQHR